MSELIQKDEDSSFRWRLLTEASVLALIGYVSAAPLANAEESDRPTVWIELGGQLSRWENSQEAYAPPFVTLTPSGFTSPLKAEKPPRYGWDETAALLFQPKGSDWTFSASLRYGRSSNSKHVRQQSSPAYYTVYSKFHRSSYGVYRHHTNHQQVKPAAARFVDVTAQQSESHTILDFQAGKDLGIGLFGRSASSILDVGVRFAQFTARSVIKLKENPDWKFKTFFTGFATAYDRYGYFYSVSRKAQRAGQPYHSFAGTFLANRSFNGLGPSISWNSSEPLVGNSERGALTFDWGVDAALLFGRQKAKIRHQTTALFHSTYAGLGDKMTAYRHPATPDHIRSRGVVVPNLGAFAGFSVKYPNAKISFGYKADFFFGGMDGGIDVRRTEDVGFHGPYASVNVGLGG